MGKSGTRADEDDIEGLRQISIDVIACIRRYGDFTYTL